MSERAEFIKKMEDELRKPKGEQNSELIAFWKNELNKVPTADKKAHTAGKDVVKSFLTLITMSDKFI